MKKALNVFSFFIFILFIYGCDSESPLSEVELKDPTVLTAKLKILKVDDINNISRKMTLTFYDKNSNYVLLKNGNVKVNGVEAPIDSLTGEGKFYNCLSALGGNLQKNFTYNFQVTLGGDPKNPVSFNFKTLEKDLIFMNVPPTHSKTKNLRVTWNEYSGTQAYELELTIYYLEFGNERFFISIIPVPADSAEIGGYTIDKSFFNTRANTFKVDIRLTTSKKEELVNFARGSEAICEFVIRRSVNITN